MSKSTNSAVIQNKNLILIAVFGFGGMLTAILASIAVVTPLVGAQVNSALALQTSRQNAQVASIQPVSSVTSAAHDVDHCTAPVEQSATVTNEAPAPTGGMGAGLWTASYKMDVKKTPYIPHAAPVAKISNSGNTSVTTNNNTNVNNTNTTTTIGSNNTHTSNKTDIDVKVKDSFNKGSYNTDVDVKVKDSFNLTENKNSNNTAINSGNLNSGNVASGNTLTDKSTTYNTDITVKDSGNTTTNSNNDILSNNDVKVVDVDVDSHDIDQTGLINGALQVN